MKQSMCLNLFERSSGGDVSDGQFVEFLCPMRVNGCGCSCEWSLIFVTRALLAAENRSLAAAGVMYIEGVRRSTKE
jgi:hypothetical protein